MSSVDNESSTFGDLTGDGQPELICMHKGELGYANPDPKSPTQTWVFRPVTAGRDWTNYTHGLGYGDVNADGRTDLLTNDGWYEQPAVHIDGSMWTAHPFPFAKSGGSQMFAYDVDRDGDNDVVSSLNAHGCGLSWFENVKAKDADATDKIDSQTGRTTC